MPSPSRTRRRFGRIRKLPSGRYQASYYHEGKRYTADHTFPAKATGDAWLAGVRTDIGRGAWIDPNAGAVTLREYADQWLANRHDLSERTAELYRWLLDRHTLPVLGDKRLVAITPSGVRSWHAGIAKAHPSTAAKAYRLLSTILRTAVEDRHLVVNPCKVKGAGRETAPERPLATIAEVQALADAMPARLRLAVLLAAWCQLRRGELLGLRRRDVDLLHATLSISVTRVQMMTTGRSIEKSPKTAAGVRTVAVPPNIADDLARHLSEHVGTPANARLFDVAPLTLDKAWSAARAKVGRPELHLHDLRHTGLTLAAATGATVAELMHRAGHASPAAALRYQHATADRDRALADALAALAPVADVVPLAGAES